MADLTAVPTQLLTDIADKIREKRDITDSIPVPDMAMQIGLISGGGADWGYGGTDPELIYSSHKAYDISDTSFIVGNPTTGTILPSVTNYIMFGINLAESDYVIMQKMKIKPIHSSDAAGLRQISSCLLNLSYITWNSFASAECSSITNQQTTYNYRFSASDKIELNRNGGAGMSAILQNPSTTSTSVIPTFRLNSPSLNVSTNFVESADNLKKITSCTWDWTVDIYRVDAHTTPFGIFQSAEADIIQ